MSQQNKAAGWAFLADGEFVLEHPEETSYLYFPLANEAGMMCAITPRLHGDSKTGQKSFLLPPVSAEDLHNTKSARNFWLYIQGFGPWSLTGITPKQILNRQDETLTLRAGFLWHRITRKNRRLQIEGEVTSFVPVNEDHVELMKVKITNTGTQEVCFTPTAAVPIYGRSADHLRDHRHVTSLLQRIYTVQHGVVASPTISFDERHHQANTTNYCVLGAEGDGRPPVGFYPVLEEFVGEGGSLEWPEKVVVQAEDFSGASREVAGYEAIGALRFAPARIGPGETKSYIIIMGINDDSGDFKAWAEAMAQKYGAEAEFDCFWQDNIGYWQEKLGRLRFATGDRHFDLWLKWVTIQPILRRIYGCSFLPYHDYGRGGRGWRDLWQDCLALLLMDPADVHQLLWNNFAGVRMDGSNATIIGATPGEFLADRNNIPRIWSDHGAWPLLTTVLYLDLTGDLDFLLEEQCYFKDHLTHRARAVDEEWRVEDGYRQKDVHGRIYQGTILEHLLLQNVTVFYNVGSHNNLRLEGADWNDALDMATEKGETVAFTAFYGGNLRELARLLRALQAKHLETLELAEEMLILFDTISGRIDYNSVPEKRALLHRYFDACRHTVSGKKVKVRISEVLADLDAKADWIFTHLRRQEWIRNNEGFAWFNGYYDDDGRRVEGDHPRGVRMTLTGQVFPIMSGVAEEEQVAKIVQAANRYLLDANLGGYRLNTDFHEVKLNLGRGFAFAYGHKENGSVFSHMAVMYAYALYKRGYVREGRFVLTTLYRHCVDFNKCRIYPGIPEYINEKGRGMYHYLTGSASWLLLTMVTEVFGIKGRLGALCLEPKLSKEEFRKGAASINTVFAERKVTVTYENPQELDYGAYRIASIKLNGETVEFTAREEQAVIGREKLTGFPAGRNIEITVVLREK